MAAAFSLLALAPALCLLVLATLAKESQAFWTDAGGFPPWSRECLKTLYYPYLALCMVWMSVVGLQTFRSRPRVPCLFILLAAACAALLTLALGILLFNNLANLLQLRPLHYHEP